MSLGMSRLRALFSPLMSTKLYNSSLCSTRKTRLFPSVRTINTTQRRWQDDDEAASKADDKKKYFTFHSVETSIRYMQSDVFKQTYRDVLVWEPYRRNHKGAFPPSQTRSKCIRGKVVATGNPCPICRDEYLVVDPRNIELLKQFTSSETGLLLPYQKTGVCQDQHRRLLIALEQAWDLGYIEKPLPHITYDYAEYYPDQERHL
ncbi:hypothetical protein CAPTEDRAFT_167201 [Capitella teleta]|uniref:Small ribosomal subunit protein mS40 n=1 Tax=Capitella teleta TaxID=283909 RepID=R7TPW8_CAPTE|nr:hypothetical protein CAPTEDRAFT_167201 [Capitella teleta]|eukprot:ELT95923.1 hypothetical protein CAPTEDRAFT_167201 [Capitella teleta]